jgi:hypothetical protein
VAWGRALAELHVAAAGDRPSTAQHIGVSMWDAFAVGKEGLSLPSPAGHVAMVGAAALAADGAPVVIRAEPDVLPLAGTIASRCAAAFTEVLIWGPPWSPDEAAADASGLYALSPSLWSRVHDWTNATYLALQTTPWSGRRLRQWWVPSGLEDVWASQTPPSLAPGAAYPATSPLTAMDAVATARLAARLITDGEPVLSALALVTQRGWSQSSFVSRLNTPRPSSGSE